MTEKSIVFKESNLITTTKSYVMFQREIKTKLYSSENVDWRDHELDQIINCVRAYKKKVAETLGIYFPQGKTSPRNFSLVIRNLTRKNSKQEENCKKRFFV